MYFKNFPTTKYKFGTENYSVNAVNLLSYVDIIDDIKDVIDFYTYYNLLDQRPDQLSYELYDTSEYYWTFFLMNDHIRRQGWPLSKRQAENTAKYVYSGTTVTTKDQIGSTFALGDTVVGITSAETGTVVRRNLDLGQIIVSGSLEFINGELIEDTDGNRVEVASSSDEYNSAKVYVNGDNEPTDFDPSVGPGSLLTAVTYMDYYLEENEKLKSIRVIKPEAINSVVAAFKEAIRTV